MHPTAAPGAPTVRSLPGAAPPVSNLLPAMPAVRCGQLRHAGPIRWLPLPGMRCWVHAEHRQNGLRESNAPPLGPQAGSWGAARCLVGWVCTAALLACTEQLLACAGPPALAAVQRRCGCGLSLGGCSTSGAGQRPEMGRCLGRLLAWLWSFLPPGWLSLPFTGSSLTAHCDHAGCATYDSSCRCTSCNADKTLNDYKTLCVSAALQGLQHAEAQRHDRGLRDPGLHVSQVLPAGSCPCSALLSPVARRMMQAANARPAAQACSIPLPLPA